MIGFTIRIWHLGDLSLWWDELYTGLCVNQIITNYIPILPSGYQIYWRGISYHYLVTLFVLIFQNNEFWIRFPSVLFGIGIVWITFFMTRKIDKKLALIVLFFLTFSPYNIEFSRFARFYIMNSFLFMLALLTFWKGFFKDNKKYKYISTLIFIIMMHTVQFGVIYLSFVGSFIISKLICIRNINDIKYTIKNNIENSIHFIIYIFFFYRKYIQ